MQKDLRSSIAQKLLKDLRNKTPPLIHEPTKEYKEALLPITTDLKPRFVFRDELISNVVQKTISYNLTRDIFGNWKEQKEKVTLAIFHGNIITKATRLTYTPPNRAVELQYSRTKKIGIEFVAIRTGGTDHSATFKLKFCGHRPRYPTEYKSIHPYREFEATTIKDADVFRTTNFFSTEWPFSTIHIVIELRVSEAAHDPHYTIYLYLTFESL